MLIENFNKILLIVAMYKNKMNDFVEPNELNQVEVLKRKYEDDNVFYDYFGAICDQESEKLNSINCPNKKLKVTSEKDKMFEIFQPWALTTYGEQTKTKTITSRKKSRILQAMEGKEYNKPDSSKFRFWVKSKGFVTELPSDFGNHLDIPTDNQPLYVTSVGKNFSAKSYRKVAVVEEFFEIIYNVHVLLGGRNKRHAGQKRTYRIISETFAFLPREAVTKFLSMCPECQKNLRQNSPYSEASSAKLIETDKVKADSSPDAMNTVDSPQKVESEVSKSLKICFSDFLCQYNKELFTNYNETDNNSIFRSIVEDQRDSLDLSKLKPITSTYLQLTRSMGLSDIDALQFNDFVSDDFKYTL